MSGDTACPSRPPFRDGVQLAHFRTKLTLAAARENWIDFNPGNKYLPRITAKSKLGELAYPNYYIYSAGRTDQTTPCLQLSFITSSKAKRSRTFTSTTYLPAQNNNTQLKTSSFPDTRPLLRTNKYGAKDLWENNNPTNTTNPTENHRLTTHTIPHHGSKMSALKARQPLGNLSAPAPRQPCSARARAPRRTPIWRRHLEDNTDTKGMQVQRLFPGIRPARGGRKENDPWNKLETFSIRCGSSKHVAVVHSAVVLQQSRWLRDQVARRDDPEAAVRTPGYIMWWQVAWALEYMYEGRVPGFEVLTGEATPERYGERPSRSIGWGLLELWDAAHFFGLGGLKARAEKAFKEYFSRGIRRAILVDRRTVTPRPGELVAQAARRGTGPEDRLIYEFSLTAWMIFDDLGPLQPEYINTVEHWCDWHLPSLAAQDEYNGLLAWESTMFDKAGALDDEDSLFWGGTRRSALALGPVMVDSCMQFAESGLFELEWFQDLIPESPERFRASLGGELRRRGFGI